MSDDAKRLAAIRRRVDRARLFPINTCPASRHLHMIADALASGKKYHMLDEEPQHCAETMYAVLESLWKLRTKHPLTPAAKLKAAQQAARAFAKAFNTAETPGKGSIGEGPARDGANTNG